jgi:ESS family glutamate:Na+ symporter
VASILFGLIYGLADVQFKFQLDLRDELLIVFFASIGLSTRYETMIKGGKILAIMAVVAIVFMFLQNGVGALVASVAGLDPLVGVLGGSVSMAGGPGTATAWAPIFQKDHGIDSASEIGNAFATVGMVLGGILGGPLAARLVTRHKLEHQSDAIPDIGTEYTEKKVEISYDSMLRTILTIGITVGIGLGIDQLFQMINFKLPTFAACMVAGILVINIGPLLFRSLNFPKPNQSRSLALVSELSVGLVLVMSLMTMQLWTLAKVGPVIIVILVIQTVLVMVFAAVVVFRAMGSNYDAAVMASGYVGIFLGGFSTYSARCRLMAGSGHSKGSAKASALVSKPGI